MIVLTMDNLVGIQFWKVQHFNSHKKMDQDIAEYSFRPLFKY